MAKLYAKGFRQSADATCGPASVILATQSLGLKEKQEAAWRSPKFSRWLPVHQFLERGMALHELLFISELLYRGKINFSLQRAYPENKPFFLQDVVESLSLKKSILIVNYKQDDFVAHNPPCVQGNPHYSPLIDWDESKNQLLVADVDPLIQKPYWVSLDALFSSMAKINPAFHLPRGWLKLSLRSSQ